MLKHIKPIIPYAILVFIVAATYANTLGHGFVWDDAIFVTYRSDAYKYFDLYKILFTLSTNGLEYLPVRDLSYALDFALWGSNPAGFHLVNVTLFALNVMVMFTVTLKLLQLLRERFHTDSAENSKTAAFFTAALFAVHPLHGEVVNFITMRNALLCGLFFFLACHAYLQYLTSVKNRRRWWYAGALVCFILTIFSKATGIIVPLILVMLTFTFRRPQRLSGWLPLFPFLLGSGGAFLLFKHFATASRIIEPSPLGAPAQILGKIVLAAQIPFFYLYKMAVPAGYSVDYDVNLFGSGVSDYRVAGSLLLIGAITAVSWKLRHRMPHVAFCSLWYLATLLPVLHFFQTNPVVADRYAFLPSYPVFMLAVVSGSRWNITNRFRTGFSVLAVAVLIALAGTSAARNRIWKSDKSLWEYTVQTAPHSAAAHINLARLLFIDENEYDRGLAVAKKAQQLHPRDTNYDVFQGVLHLRGNDPLSAIIDFNRALERNSEHMEALVNVAAAYQMLGDRAKAALYLQRAVNSTEPDAPGDLRETAREKLRELARENP